MRFNSYKDNDFIGTHSNIINSIGAVWMVKLGKKIPEKSLEMFIAAGGHLILKAPKSDGGRYYYAHMKEYHIGEPKSNFTYPEYYQVMIDEMCDFSLDGTWICIDSIKSFDAKLIDHLYLRNGKTLADVVNKTRTATFYVSSDRDLQE